VSRTAMMRKKARPTNERLAPMAADARESATKYVEETRDWAAPKVEAAKEWAAPRAEAAVTTVKEDVIPKIAEAVTVALAASEPVREEAVSRGAAAVAALRGDIQAPKPKKHRLRKLFFLAAVLGAAYAGWKAWNAQNRPAEPDAWATPLPPDPALSTPSAMTDDVAGASPDEALADAADETSAAQFPEASITATEPVSAARSKRAQQEADAARGDS
jgi:hypothetical protein